MISGDIFFHFDDTLAFMTRKGDRLVIITYFAEIDITDSIGELLTRERDKFFDSKKENAECNTPTSSS